MRKDWKKTAIVILEIAVVYLILMAIMHFGTAIVNLGNTLFAQMALYVAVYAVFAAVPILALLITKTPLSILKFQKTAVGRQIAWGLCVFALTMLLYVGLPLLLGASKSMVLSYKSPTVGILVFYALFDLICVGLGEELAFRGYLLGRIMSITSVPWLPLLLSALLYGAMYYPITQSWFSVATATVIGLIYGFFRWKVKNCTVLSLAIAHGLNEAVIVVASYFLL